MDPIEQARHRTTVARCQLGDGQALLRQDPGSSIGTEIETLHALVAADDRRALRLIIGTIAVWVCGTR
jgi:hypothetical protein